MTRDERLDRRSVVKAIGGLAVAGVLAGCSGSGGDGGSDGSGGDGGSGDGGEATDTTAESEGTPTDDGSSGDGTSGDGSSDGGSGGASFDGYLDDADNFDGTVVDETGADEVQVAVGSEANGGYFGFDPAAVRVSSGTTVVWEWTGEGGSHNVVDEGGSFSSDLTDESGHTFSQTFDSAGTVKYYCEPHKSLGMKGVVVVE